ncbi:hypothetical protein [Streptomyces sp. SID10815]|uniref:hypothetical protein n=1 Tax=Streptomyces sp. SID10815 TaxID=2706027 RepID=UPI00194441E5|nr:hypothetical protein [Streptomyces sp. SID10815]
MTIQTAGLSDPAVRAFVTFVLVARHRNDTWGEMRTRRLFTVAQDGRISRFETGQA